MKWFAILGAWAVTLALAFAVGQFRGTTTVEPESAVVPKAETSAVADSALANTANKVADSATPVAALPDTPKATMTVVDKRPALTSVVRDASFAERMTAVLKDAHPVRRAAGFAALLVNITPEQAASLYATLAEGPQNRETDREKRLLMFAWGEVDGAAAVAAAEADRSGGGWRDRGRGSLLDAALSGWASMDPAAAEAWARSKSDKPENPYLIGVIAGTAMTDPDLAAKQIYTLPFGEVRGRAARSLIDAYLREGITATQMRISAMPADKLKDGMVRIAAGEMAEQDPAATAAWLASLQDVNVDDALREVGREWVRDDPDAALTWAQSLANAETRAGTIANVVGHWPSDRFQEIETWVIAITDPQERDAAARAIAFRQAMRGDESALAWVDTISDPTLREQAHKDLERISQRRTRGRP